MRTYKRLRPNGFYQQVKKQLGNVTISNSLISMVKSGKRKNDSVLMAIIHVDHYWKILNV